eukprot:2500352-Karenia_brevis.AAC.1
MEAQFKSIGYERRKIAWKSSGLPVCRHGVLFSSAQATNDCPCMQQSPNQGAWRHARHMPALDHNLKKIICKRFDSNSFKRIGLLKAEMVRMGWC